jgi:glucose/arabinose dehydrogenase
MTGIQGGWDFAFAPDGQTIFFTERCRGLSVRMSNGTVARLFGTAGSNLQASDFVCEGQSGMNGVAVDPDFNNNRFVYVYMASSASNPRTNRVIRLTIGADMASASSRTEIIDNISYKTLPTAAGGAGLNSGGRIRFGPDDFLYVTTGDNHDGALPQDLSRLGGKVLRVDRNGAGARGNNVPMGGDARIYTYGHRNVQGISFRGGSRVFISEHGPNHSDEVTRLVAGGNGGWDPQARLFISCPDNYCGDSGNSLTMPMTDVLRFPNAMQPSWTNGGLSQGMGASEFLADKSWRGWENRLAVAFMGAQRLAILRMNNDDEVTSTTDLIGLPADRYRSLVLGPDGNLYILAENAGEIWRITPGNGGDDDAPVP